MNIRCPDCHTLYRLNSRRVPAEGANARCSRCGTVFPLGRAPAAAPEAHPSAAAPQGNAPAAAPSAHTSVPAPAEAAGGGSEVSTVPAPAGNGSPFSTEGETRAKRFARALVSDIVAYHPNLMAESSDPTAIQETFREEIMKSWQEYVAQVGREAAEGTPYFREALNDLLADGRKVF